MKQALFFILTLTILTSCNNNVENKNVGTSLKTDTSKKEILKRNDTANNYEVLEKTSTPDSSLKGEFKNFKIFNLADTIKADLNGDKILDFAYFANNEKKDIYIIDGKTKMETKVGLDKSFGNMGSSFGWVDFWGTTNDSETYEIIIKDSEIIGDRKVKLENTSLILRKDEVGGGVITFKNGQYIWVHQSD